jgi:hypothetical protein
VNPLDQQLLRQAVREHRIEWRKHALQKLAERGLPLDAVREALVTGERIQDYAEDRPFPSALFLGYIQGRPLHVVASYDEASQKAFVITAYEPSMGVFESDYRTRKRL